MKGMTDNIEGVGLTPEYVLDLGRRTWFESILNSMPDSELFKIDRTAAIWRKGALEGREEGLVAGEHQGRRAEAVRFLVRLLTKRFGPLSGSLHEWIASADLDTLEQWGDRVLDVGSLEELFDWHGSETTH